MSRWQGATVVVIASGPSLTVDDCEQVRQWRNSGDGRRVIVINTSYQRAPFADALYACDGTWWTRNILDVRKTFRGELWTRDEVAATSYGLNYIKSERRDGLSRKPGVIHEGSNSGFQAINLAQQWGSKRIVLLGFDMSDDGSKTHWHKPHERAVKSPYERWIEMFRKLATDLQADGVAVVNCTRRTSLRCFPLVPLEAELAGAVLAT